VDEKLVSVDLGNNMIKRMPTLLVGKLSEPSAASHSSDIMSKAKTVMHTVEAISHYLLTSAKLKKPIDDNVRSHCVFVLTYQARRLFALLTKQEHHYSTRVAHENHSIDALMKVRKDLGGITGTIDRVTKKAVGLKFCNNVMVRQGAMAERGTSVVIHLYDLTSPSVNTVLSDVVGLGGAFHAAVEVYGVEWSYGHCQYGCGIFAVPPTSSELGVTEVVHILEGLAREWLGSSYDILNRNCTHFCDVFLRKLLPGEGCLLPPKVVRLASLADEWIRGGRGFNRGLIDTGAPPERVTISTVDEEALMIREWRQ
ncbi:hypothetical protein FOZ63_027022, partial [Perkinsus olseni]